MITSDELIHYFHGIRITDELTIEQHQQQLKSWLDYAVEVAKDSCQTSNAPVVTDISVESSKDRYDPNVESTLEYSMKNNGLLKLKLVDESSHLIAGMDVVIEYILSQGNKINIY